MSFKSSIFALCQLMREDTQLAHMGARYGDLLRLHYSGRMAARSALTPRSRILKFSQNKKHVRVELSGPYLGAFKGVFLDQEYECRQKFEILPRRILDLGANIGMGAIHFACQFPDAEILCIEPDPRNISLLERNLRENAVNASLVEAAIGPEAGKLLLRFGDNPTCSALESSPMHHLSDATEVSVMTVPGVMESHGWDSVDLVKIDIEGSEDELLAKNNDWLTKVGAIILEIHPNTSEQKIASYLAPYGFRLNRIGFGREPVYFGMRECFPRSV